MQKIKYVIPRAIHFLFQDFFEYFSIFLLFAITPHNEVSSCSFPWELKFLDELVMLKGKRAPTPRVSFNSDFKTRNGDLTLHQAWSLFCQL